VLPPDRHRYCTSAEKEIALDKIKNRACLTARNRTGFYIVNTQDFM
jgi:hypothetical protein